MHAPYGGTPGLLLLDSLMEFGHTSQQPPSWANEVNYVQLWYPITFLLWNLNISYKFQLHMEIISLELNWCLLEVNETVSTLQRCCSVSADLHALDHRDCIWLPFSPFFHNDINQKYINNGSWKTVSIKTLAFWY